MERHVIVNRLIARWAEITKTKYDRAFVSQVDEILLTGDVEHIRQSWTVYIDDELKKIWPFVDRLHRLIICLVAVKLEQSHRALP